VNRLTQGMVLLLVGLAVLRASLTDLYLRYVKAGLRPLLLGAAVVLIVAALLTLWYELRRKSAQHEGHGHHGLRVSWLLLLPLCGLILVAPPALGSYAANRTGTALQPPPGLFPMPAGDPAVLGVHDYAWRAAYDHGRSIGDRRVQITGFITVGAHGTPYLTRMILNCCAADGQPIKVGLSGQVPPDLQPDVWIQVVGTYTDKLAKDEVNGGPIPYINVIQARKVAPPHDPYES
jgi:uncharacterized repeat protein (TIGR03943 family)